MSDTYKAELEALFKALLGLTRETHVKQLEIPLAGAAGPGSELTLIIRPELTVEPVVTYYLRRARSYAFVRTVVSRYFGDQALQATARLTPSGTVNMPLLDELRLMEQIFYGAAERSSRELGLTEDPNVSAHDATEGLAVYDTWRQTLAGDPDLGADVRMMVPVFYDVARKKMKVWAVLGCASKPLSVSFHRPPTVIQVLDDAGRTVPLDSVRVNFTAERHDLVYLVSAEVYVDEPMTRAEFRRHCDRYRTFAAILEHLR
jgi:hypothetical protein